MNLKKLNFNLFFCLCLFGTINITASVKAEPVQTQSLSQSHGQTQGQAQSQIQNQGQAQPQVQAAPESNFEPQTAKTVIVTAGRVEEKAENITAVVTVIPQEEIKKNQYQDLGYLLRNYGIQINSFNQNSGLSQISIRGIRSSALGSDLQGAVLILVDGRRIGTDNVFMVPMVNIERIEIIRGPASVQYGTSAIGGVVNIITKKGTKDLSASAELGTGSFATYKSQGSFALAKGPFDFSAGVSYLNSGDYYIGGDEKYTNTGINYKTAYSSNLGFSFLEEQRLSLTVLGVFADNMGSPGYFNDLRPDEYTNRSNYSADLVYEGGHKDYGLFWMGRYFSGRNNYLSDKHNDFEGLSYFKSYTNYRGSQGQISFNKNFLTLTTGLDWLNYYTNTQGYYYPKHETAGYDNTGIFALAKFAFFDDKFILSSGFRHDRYALQTDGKEQNLKHNTPSLGFAFHATDWLTLKSNYGEAFRIPDAVALLGFKGMMTSIPNPNLKPEEAKSYDFGFEIQHKSFNFGLAYFQTEYQNKILTHFTPDYETQYYNAKEKIWYKGFEGNISYDLGEALDAPFNLRPYLSFTKMIEGKSKDGSTVPNLSDLELAYGLNFKYPEKGFEADLRFNYSGKQYVMDFNMLNSTRDQLVKIGGTTTADLFLTQRIYSWDKGGTLSLNAEVRNIFDARYAFVKDYPQPGRYFYLGLRYDY